jgi:Tfp pilus assembly protein PilF
MTKHKCFQEGLKISPDNSRILHGLGMFFVSRVDIKNLSNYIQKLLLFREISQGYGTIVAMHFSKVGRTEEARQDYETAVQNLMKF